PADEEQVVVEDGEVVGEPGSAPALRVRQGVDDVGQADADVEQPPCVVLSANAADEAHAYAAAVADPRSPRYGVQRCGMRGAASLMKSTGCGGRGGCGRFMPTCSSVRSPFRRLHGAQAVTTF